MAHTLVGRNDCVKFGLGDCEQHAIIELAPPHFVRCRDGMADQRATKRRRSPVVKEYLHVKS